jgi:hypothetical protein
MGLLRIPEPFDSPDFIFEPKRDEASTDDMTTFVSIHADFH